MPQKNVLLLSLDLSDVLQTKQVRVNSIKFLFLKNETAAYPMYSVQFEQDIQPGLVFTSVSHEGV